MIRRASVSALGEFTATTVMQHVEHSGAPDSPTSSLPEDGMVRRFAVRGTLGRRPLLRLAGSAAVAALAACTGAAAPPTPQAPTPFPSATPAPPPASPPTAVPTSAPAPVSTALAPASPTPSATSGQGLHSDRLFPQLVALVEQQMARLGVPGVAVGVIDGGAEYTAARGVTSVANPLPVDTDTLFQIGSISKTFTTAAAMRLVDDGTLDLDRPVRTYLPQFRLASEDAARVLTPRHLMTHTGGFVGDYFPDTGRGDDALARYVASLAGQEQLTWPGEVYSYSNAGFSVLGRIVEVLTGEIYEAAVRRLVMAPLGLLRKTVLFPEQAMLQRFAVGHRNPAGAPPLVAEPWELPRGAIPAGGVIASLRDQLRYGSFWLGQGLAPDGRRVLSNASTGAMTAGGRVPSWPSIGLAWNIGGAGTIFHSGSTVGQQAFLMVSLSGRLVFSVLTNAARGGELIRAAADWVYEQYFGLPFRPLSVFPWPPEVLDTYAGRYVGPLQDVVLARDGENLQLRTIPKGGFPTLDTLPGPPPPPQRLGLASQDRLVGLDDPKQLPTLQVVRVGGQIAFVRYGGRLHRREDYTPVLRPAGPTPTVAAPTSVAGRSDTTGVSAGSRSTGP